jgi:hypothetical protein
MGRGWRVCWRLFGGGRWIDSLSFSSAVSIGAFGLLGVKCWRLSGLSSLCCCDKRMWRRTCCLAILMMRGLGFYSETFMEGSSSREGEVSHRKFFVEVQTGLVP